MISPLDHMPFHHEETSPVPLKERLCALRLTLQQACLQIESQLTALDDGKLNHSPTQQASSGSTPATLFESAPVSLKQNQPTIGVEKILAPAATVQIDPLLEKATLEELNSALSQAFAQIAAKRIW